MKVLVVVEDIGRTAPGIVFERLIRELSRRCQVDLIVSEYCPSLKLDNVSEISIVKKKYVHPKLSFLFFSIFTLDFTDFAWCRKILKRIENKNKYDIVFSLIASSRMTSLIVSHLFKNSSVKRVVYSVDAIPAPKWWSGSELHYNVFLRMMKKYLSRIDLLFLSNGQMMQYMKNILSSKNNMEYEVLYTPSTEGLKYFQYVKCETYNFVYTGGIYGPRKASYLLAGFKKLLEKYPNSKLQFVGSRISNDILIQYDNDFLRCIEIIPRVDDLDPFYEKAVALIDIDADVDNDVFISSKMSNYLVVNRLIISETGRNSPSRNLFKGIDSIMQCDHDSEQLYNAMKKAIEMEKNVNVYADRNDVIRLFSVKDIVDKLMNIFQSL